MSQMCLWNFGLSIVLWILILPGYLEDVHIGLLVLWDELFHSRPYRMFIPDRKYNVSLSGSRHVLNWTDCTITQIHSEPPGCWGGFAQKAVPCWIIFHGKQWKCHIPKSVEAFGTKSGRNAKPSSFGPQERSGMDGWMDEAVFILISVTKTGAFVIPCIVCPNPFWFVFLFLSLSCSFRLHHLHGKR